MDIPVSTLGLPDLNEPGGTLRLAQIARLLRRHAWLIGGLAVIAAGGAFLVARSLPKTYTASSAITVEGDRFAIPELQGALRGENAPDPMPWVRTEVQALTSRALVQDVITKLSLDKNPEFNTALRPPTLLQQVKSAITSLLPPSTDAKAPPGPDEYVLANVMKALVVFQDNRSLVISTGFTAQDPQLASNVVNTLIASYIQGRAARRVDANRGANDVMVSRINQVKSELDGIEQQMRDLRNKGQLVGLRAGSVGQQQLEDLASAAARASVERAQLEANWDRANTLSKQGMSDALASVLNSPTISNLRAQEATASRRVADLTSRYGAGYPGVRSARADLQAVQGQISGEVQRIVASLDAQLRVARQQEADVNQQLATARQAGVASANVQAQLTDLQQEAATRRALYQTLLTREQQTVAQPTGTETPDVRILSTAVPPGSPTGPNTKMITGAGGLSGVLLGCLVALLRLRSVDTFETAPDFTRATGLPVLAVLPRGLALSGRTALASTVMTAPTEPGADALRKLRTKLRFVGRSRAPRSILFTSAAGRGDAAASAAAGFAAAFARVAAADGEHVLLLEGNLAAPGLGRLLGIESDGLTELFDIGADWRDTVAADPQSPLDLLLVGQPLANSHGLLSGVTFQNLLVEVRQDYDLVVMDAPAAGSADAAALALRADATVLLIDGKADQPSIREAIARLGGGVSAPLGAVMTS